MTDRLPPAGRGSRLARALLRLAGWELVFDGLPARQGILIAYPHTSNWDFVVGVLAKWSLGLHLSFWGKDSLFRLPLFGRWLRWLGGIPVDRFNASGIVADMVARFRRARAQDDFLWLALAPEGTRRHQPHWRSGFYQVAVQAGVPLGLAFFDYRRRRVGVQGFLRLSGERQVDLAAIACAYDGVIGRHPDLAGPIALKE
ncbi:1-acyl-sn-glycerol-3-phosphate acyltransferase [Ideonella sp.]|uniref:1-acyl-sn-glycerol-3-phosphate acyltransferase n=1 Tax=Ideonella sp. TaxID=1929293 RepID=UPI002B4A648C|nr:1-acyl-sn-glycerol-3-phosphate acyltransferase [Ideonella sp.]HJV68581.1 1-acyl-sn-glycerol-3-phosphate acyltransferase [Ideonella sp.]